MNLQAVLSISHHSNRIIVLLVIASSITSPTAHAVTIDMVTVGNPGNAPDTEVMTCCGSMVGTSGFGSVGYSYQIAKYEVTAGQYTEFLNSVAKADPHGLYNAAMVDTTCCNSFGANIQRSGSSPNFSYSVAADWANLPVNYVSFWDTARFANWLHNGQPVGAQGPGTTEDGAYHDVGNQTLFGRNAGAKFFIPTENEWYKGAYHDKTAGLAAAYFDYPTGTNVFPDHDINEVFNTGNNANYYFNNYVIGSPYYRTVAGEFELSDSPYGTFDQGGNVWEWNESKVTGSARGFRGGSFDSTSGWTELSASTRSGNDPTVENGRIGFRIASSIPEPSTLLLLCFGSLAALWRKRGLLCASILAVVVWATSAQAVTIDTVPVGNPGNTPDTRYDRAGFGSVAYAYQIGKYEVTAGQYTEFLNAVAKDDPNGLYNTDMVSLTGANIVRTGSSPNFSYSVASDWANRPVNYVSFWDAARFANWLHNGQPTGAQGPTTTEGGAYHDVGNPTLFGRSAGAVFFIPTENEWYKAAYHHPDAGLAAFYFDYPTGSNTVPINTLPDYGNHANLYDISDFSNHRETIGLPYFRTEVGAFSKSASPYGTFDQGGNVQEWNETVVDDIFFGLRLGVRGGSWTNFWGSLRADGRGASDPADELSYRGFRVASIPAPEPSTLLLLSFGSLAVLWRIRTLTRKRRGDANSNKGFIYPLA